MENLKHTKGPWTNGWGNGLTGPTTINNHPTVSRGELDYIPISKTRETIAAVIQQDNQNGKEEMIANAKLIAAAPELLEALIELLHYVPVGSIHHSVLDKADSAINKATK